MTYVGLRPDHVRLVEVLADDGQWHVGGLMAYRLEDGVWSGWAHWTARSAGATSLDLRGSFAE